MAPWWKFWAHGGSRVHLIFRWRRSHGFSFRLVFFLFLSTALHFAAFYLFKVVYPPNKKYLPRDAGVWMLPAGDPQVQALLARHAALLGTFSGAVPAGQPAELTRPVEMRLSFDGYQPGFAPLPPRGLNRPLEFPDAVPTVLPATVEMADIPPVSPVVAESAHRPMARWSLPAGGTVDAAWQLPARGFPDDLPEEAHWVMQVRVGPDGRVGEAVLVQGTGTSADAIIRRHVIGWPVPVEMIPAAGTPPVWISLGLRPPATIP